jgi:hypothetical protein
MRFIDASVAALILLFGLTAPVPAAEAPVYQDYQTTSDKTEFFTLSFDAQTLQLTYPDGNDDRDLSFRLSSINTDSRPIHLSSRVDIDDSGIVIDDFRLDFANISDLRIDKTGRMTRVTFYRLALEGSDPARVRRGNVISTFDDVSVDIATFVRGAVFTVTGNVEVLGEVNKDIVSLFGDIFIGPDAVARGDLASITGRVQVAKEGSVYGEILTGTQRHKGSSRRFYSRTKEVEITPLLDYNRVDGFSLAGNLKFADNDSIYPSVDADYGYAFASKRTRWRFGLEQTIWRSLPLAIGGEGYRELKSEDDWLIDKQENLFFTLLWTEDFRDYYETEGARAYLRAHPFAHATAEIGYRYDETNWLKAHRNLWSLFGGDKLFPRNFHRVDEPLRSQGIAELDSTTNAFISLSGSYDTRDIENPFDFAAWAVDGRLEWSHPDFSSDFDYRRYQINVRRYQPVNRRTMLLTRLVFGGSDGYLPMYKRFYLGGLGTLRGYKHKEYTGTRFWLANGEYRFRFPHSDLAVSLLYDIGQIANDTKLSSDIEIKQSLGGALYIGDDFHVSLSKRLDGGDDSAVQFYARIEHRF